MNTIGGEKGAWRPNHMAVAGQLWESEPNQHPRATTG